jgi:hypothetical protein
LSAGLAAAGFTDLAVRLDGLLRVGADLEQSSAHRRGDAHPCWWTPCSQTAALGPRRAERARP